MSAQPQEKDAKMSDETVLVEIDDKGVATVTMNRPEVHNAFNEDVIAKLTATLEDLGKNEDVRVVILRGEGKSFSAGGDLNWMRKSADYTYDENVDDAMRLGLLLRTLYEMPMPTIALVHGNAFGGGVGLTACCDVAVAEDGTKFCLSEVRIGLIPSVIGPYVLRAIGERHARRYFLTAERFDAEEARRIGLVHEVVPQGGLDEIADTLVKAVLDGAPGAQALGKAQILEISGKPITSELIAHTSRTIAEARATDEGKEGLSAFLEKRDPNWRT